MSKELKQSQPLNDGESYIKVADLKECLLLHADYCQEFIRETITQTSTYQDLDNIEKDDIPLHITDLIPGTFQHHILKCRLEGTDPLEENLSLCMQILWDTEFNVDDYRNVGRNDGQIDILSLLLKKLDMHTEAEKVSEAQYTID